VCHADTRWGLVKRYPDLLFAAGYLVVGLLWVWSMPNLARLDRDEGFNIMKAALVERGFHLYGEIWSDQPPLFTYLLVGWRKVFGPSDAAARSLVVIITCIGLASVGRIATWIGRTPAAGLMAVLLLVAARSYPKLSMAVMIGLPAISVALLSVWLMIASRRWRFRWIVMFVCGAVFACSMQIKLFTFILAPMALLTLLPTNRDDPRLTPRRKSRIICDVALVFVGFAVITLYIAPFEYQSWQHQLILTHLKSGLATDDTQMASLRSILMRFLEDGPLMLAFFSTMILAGKDNFRRLLPMVLWMATSILVLSQANPLWGHHRVMFSIPAAVMTAVATAAIFNLQNRADNPLGALRNKSQQIARVMLTIALGYGAASLVYALTTLGRTREDLLDAEVLAELAKRKSQTLWVISDDPHIVHKAGLLVPPETAVLSLKRLQRDFTEERLGQIIEAYKPQMLLLARHSYTQAFLDGVTVGYRLVLKKNKERVRLFERVTPSE